jgi:hypothetical protein
MRTALGDCDHKLIADAALICHFGNLIHVNGLPAHSASVDMEVQQSSWTMERPSQRN